MPANHFAFRLGLACHNDNIVNIDNNIQYSPLVAHYKITLLMAFACLVRSGGNVEADDETLLQHHIEIGFVLGLRVQMFLVHIVIFLLPSWGHVYIQASYTLSLLLTKQKKKKKKGRRTDSFLFNAT